jgi:hypothetical protein
MPRFIEMVLSVIYIPDDPSIVVFCTTEVVQSNSMLCSMIYDRIKISTSVIQNYYLFDTIN